jgi:ATP-dependent Clp protease adapter protein ClpS
MSEQNTPQNLHEDGAGQVTPTKPRREPGARQRPPQPLPPWKVLLHNDDVNAVADVVKTVIQITPLNETQASQRVIEAHKTGVSLLLVTHRERAELYIEQFAGRGLTVTAEAE